MASIEFNVWLLTVSGYVRKASNDTIPPQLYLVINAFYQLSIESEILMEEELFPFHDMIESHVETHLKSKYIYWKLIYRATTDGFLSDAFFKKCNAKPNVIVLIQTEDIGDYVYGGYTSVGFKKSNHLYEQTQDPHAFLYSLRTNDEAYPPKIFPIKASKIEAAIYYYEGYLCCFGNTGNDLFLSFDVHSTGISGTDSYDVKDELYWFAGKSSIRNFTVREIEVFQLESDVDCHHDGINKKNNL